MKRIPIWAISPTTSAVPIWMFRVLYLRLVPGWSVQLCRSVTSRYFRPCFRRARL